MGLCLTVNRIITFLVILFAGLWFLLVVVLPQSLHLRLKNQINQILKDNWRMQSITHPIHFTGIDPQSIQLIELIDNGAPNVFGEEAILVITNDWGQIDYTSLLSSLSSLKMKGDSYRFPIYVLKQKSNSNFYNYRTIMNQARTVQFLISKCIQAHNIKRLTIISFQESALMSLLALSQAQSTLIFKVDKLIIINPFNPTHDLYQNDPRSLSRSIKRHILADKRRLVAFHHLRILLINTFRTVYPEQPNSRDYFNFAFEDEQKNKYRLNSTLSLSSKSLFDVNSFIEKGLYFHNKHFLSILMHVIIQDQKSKLSMREIEYIMRYRQHSEVQSRMSEQRARRCGVLFFQELQSNVEVKSNCFRIIQRQRYKYNHAALIFYSQDKIQVFGDGYEKIPSSSHRSKKYHINVITNLKDINQIILLAETKPVNFFIAAIRSPSRNSFHSNENPDFEQKMLSNQETSLIQSCEGWRPIMGLDNNENIKELIEWKDADCYIELQDYSLYSEWFLYNWNIIRNVIIFSLFSTHVLGAYSFNRFYTCLFINLILIYFFVGKTYVFQNMVITSTATLMEIISMGLVKGSQLFPIPNSYFSILLILPLACQLFKVSIGIFTFNLTSIKLLWLQLIFVNNQSGYIISWIKFYFLIDIYATQQSPIYSLVLLAAWQMTNMPNSPFTVNNSLARVKGKLANILFLLMLCFSLGEQGSVIHQLVDFYMITHLLLGLGELLNRLLQSNQ